MTSELIITSVPNGLFPGTYGFCAVACTKNMNERMRQALNSVSGYRRLSDDQSKNPIAFSHYIYNIGGKNYNVLSRIADAGVDYTRRTNKLAQFHVFEPGEGERLGDPATMCFTQGTFRNWNVEDKPDFLEPYRFPPYRRLNGSEAVHGAWKRLTGDAGWAGVLAGTAATRRPVAIIIPQGFDVTPLILEAVAVLPEELRWKATFSTYFTSVPPNVQCQWKTLIDGAYDAKLLNNPNTLKLDLRDPAKLGSVDAVKDDASAEYIAIARGERKVERIRRPAERESGPMLGGKKGNLEDIQDEIDILNCLNEDLPKKGRSSRSPIPTKEVRETLNSDDYTIPELVDVPEDKPAEVYRRPEKNHTALWIGLGVGFGLALACIIGFTVAIILKLSNKEEAPEAAPDAPAATAEDRPAEKQDAPKEEAEPAPVEEKTEPEPEPEEETPQPAEPEEPKEEEQQPATPAEGEKTEDVEPADQEKTEDAEPAESEEADVNADNADGEEKEAEPEPKTVEVNVDEMIPGLFTVDPNNISTIVNNLVLYAGFADALKKTIDSATEQDKKEDKDKTAADHLALYRAAKSLSKDYKGVESAEKLASQAVERAKACTQNLRKYFDALPKEDNEESRNKLYDVQPPVKTAVNTVDSRLTALQKSSMKILLENLVNIGTANNYTEVDNYLKGVDAFLKTLSVETSAGHLKSKDLDDLQESSLKRIFEIFCNDINAGAASRFEAKTSTPYLKVNKVIKGKGNVKGGEEIAWLLFGDKQKLVSTIKLTNVNDSLVKLNGTDKDGVIKERLLKEESHYHAKFVFDVVGTDKQVDFYVGLNDDGNVRLAISDDKYTAAVLSAVKFEWTISTSTVGKSSKKRKFLDSSLTDFSFEPLVGKTVPKFIEIGVVNSYAEKQNDEVFCVVEPECNVDLASQNADFIFNLEQKGSDNIKLALNFNCHEDWINNLSFGYSMTAEANIYGKTSFNDTVDWKIKSQTARCGESNTTGNFAMIGSFYSECYPNAYPNYTVEELKKRREDCSANIVTALYELTSKLKVKFYLVNSKNLANKENWIFLGEEISEKPIAEFDLVKPK